MLVPLASHAPVCNVCALFGLWTRATSLVRILEHFLSSKRNRKTCQGTPKAHHARCTQVTLTTMYITCICIVWLMAGVRMCSRGPPLGRGVFFDRRYYFNSFTCSGFNLHNHANRALDAGSARRSARYTVHQSGFGCGSGGTVDERLAAS